MVDDMGCEEGDSKQERSDELFLIKSYEQSIGKTRQ